MSDIIVFVAICMGIAHVLLKLRDWVNATAWNPAVKVLLLGLSLNVLLVAAMVASIPFVEPIITDIMTRR